MTPERLRECAAIVGLSDQRLSDVLDVDPRLVRRWRSGERAVPPDVAGWLEAFAQWMVANPPPKQRGKPRDA